MVKITDKTDEFSLIYFPKHLPSETKLHTLVVHSMSTLQDYEFNFEDQDNLHDYYVMRYSRTFEELPDGEYVYTIDNYRAIGVLAIGEYYIEHSSTADITKYEDVDETKYIYYE